MAQVTSDLGVSASTKPTRSLSRTRSRASPTIVGQQPVREQAVRQCVENPRWLRFQVTSLQSGRSLRFAHIDDANTAGEPSLALTGRVRSG